MPTFKSTTKTVTRELTIESSVQVPQMDSVAPNAHDLFADVPLIVLRDAAVTRLFEALPYIQTALGHRGKLLRAKRTTGADLFLAQ